MHRYQTDQNCPEATDEESRLVVGKRGLFFVGLIVVSMLLSAVFTVAYGQSTTRQATISWNAPTTCQGGSPITNCPILGYSVQKLIGTTWTEIGTTTAAVRTYVHRDLPLGTHTYRVLATSDAGPSPPSNESAKIIDVPGAPGNVVVTVTITVTP